MVNPHGNIKHSGVGTLTYARWKSMRQRCNNPNATNYKYYGALGITVCERWNDFSLFLADMGECRQGMTLDRIDNKKGYDPGNCRWATMTNQNRNRSYCIKLTHNGRTMILSDWAVEIGVTPNTLAMRLRVGRSVEYALQNTQKPIGENHES